MLRPLLDHVRICYGPKPNSIKCLSKTVAWWAAALQLYCSKSLLLRQRLLLPFQHHPRSAKAC